MDNRPGDIVKEAYERVQAGYIPDWCFRMFFGEILEADYIASYPESKRMLEENEQARRTP